MGSAFFIARPVATILLALGMVQSFWVAIALVAAWGIMSAIDDPVHRAYLNDMIPSKQRATVLSFDSLLGSAGGAVLQPALGRSADIGGYGFSLLLSGATSAIAVPFVLLSRAQHDPADTQREADAEAPVPADRPPTTGTAVPTERPGSSD